MSTTRQAGAVSGSEQADLRLGERQGGSQRARSLTPPQGAP